METVLPDTEQSRRLVLTLAGFWAGWGVAAIGFSVAPSIGVLAFAVAFLSGLLFYLTLYVVWERESGIPAWRMMFVPSFSKQRRRAALHLFDLVRPSWIKHTLRATGWRPWPVGIGLLALLVADLVISATVSLPSS